MTKEQALKLLASAASRCLATADEHRAFQMAIQILADAIKEGKENV